MFLYTDSIPAIKLGNKLVFHEKTKHVEKDCHFIRETIEDVFLVQVPTEDQLADFLIKVRQSIKPSFILLYPSWAQ